MQLAVGPDREYAEYAIIPGQYMRGKGLGKVIKQRIIDCARHRDIKALSADEQHSKISMLGLSQEPGFTQSDVDTDDTTVRFTLVL